MATYERDVPVRPSEELLTPGNLWKAIRSYESALRVLNRHWYPTEWALTMNNLGRMYQALPGPHRAVNLKKAIRYFDRALEVYTREGDPFEWATTMNNRGNAYLKLPCPDRSTYLQEAIRSFEPTLLVFTRETYPTRWAMTVKSLAQCLHEIEAAAATARPLGDPEPGF